MKMYDYKIICFNGANRTKNQETTDAMVIHPISKKCEKFIKKFCPENGIICLGDVAFGKGLLTTLTDALYANKLVESGTFFTDKLGK